jgi:hypothetical protein
MTEMWKPTLIEMDSVDSRGEHLIHLTDVPALTNIKTGKVRVSASEVAKAEIVQIAKENKLEPRDIALLLTIYAKPGIFKEGEVHYKYHINKLLFYQWKYMEKEGLGEAFPHDDFKKADRGPVPVNITEDLDRLTKLGLVKTTRKQWGPAERNASLKTELTPLGMKLSATLWSEMPADLKQRTLEAKKDIFPLSPTAVKEKVHAEYPEYKFTKEDTD